MCIFSKETLAKKTIIAFGEGFFSYQNSIEAQETTTMIVPVPGHNVQFWQMEAGLLDSMLTDIRDQLGLEIERARSAGIERTEEIGQYKIDYVNPGELIDALKSLDQPIQPWVPFMMTRYDGWNFLLVTMQAGDNIANQPFYVSYDPIWPGMSYAPMFDVHGNEPIKDRVMRQHAVLVKTQYGDATYNGPVEEWHGKWDCWLIGYDIPKYAYNYDIINLDSPNPAFLWRKDETLEQAVEKHHKKYSCVS